MKKTALIIIAAAAFASCKKSYTCSCTTTVTSSYGTDVYHSNDVSYSSKMSEKQAKATCDHEKEGINSTYNNYIYQNGGSGILVNTTCSVK